MAQAQHNQPLQSKGTARSVDLGSASLVIYCCQLSSHLADHFTILPLPPKQGYCFPLSRRVNPFKYCSCSVVYGTRKNSVLLNNAAAHAVYCLRVSDFYFHFVTKANAYFFIVKTSQYKVLLPLTLIHISHYFVMI
jgi:hypothetical protein